MLSRGSIFTRDQSEFPQEFLKNLNFFNFLFEVSKSIPLLKMLIIIFLLNYELFSSKSRLFLMENEFEVIFCIVCILAQFWRREAIAYLCDSNVVAH